MSLAFPLPFFSTARGHAAGHHQNKTLIASRDIHWKSLDGRKGTWVASGSPWNCKSLGLITVKPQVVLRGETSQLCAYTYRAENIIP